MPDIIEIGTLRRNLTELSRRATIDKQFRALCLENANEAYLELVGQPLPDWHPVRFIELEQESNSDETVLCMRLPRYLHETFLG